MFAMGYLAIQLYSGPLIRIVVLLAATAGCMNIVPRLPSIYSVYPNTARPGDIITVRGMNFGKKTGKVTLANQPVRLSTWSRTRIVFTVPEGAVSGKIDVAVSVAEEVGFSTIRRIRHAKAPLQIARPLKNASWKSVTVGHFHSCATHTDNSLWCWLWPAEIHGIAPLEKITETLHIESVTIDEAISCGLSQRQLYCWDYVSQPFENVSTTTATVKPTPVLPGHEWLAVGAGAGFFCGISTQHGLSCWGKGWRDDSGQTAEGGLVSLSTFADWVTLSVKGRHFCAINIRGKTTCWFSGSTNPYPIYEAENIEYESAYDGITPAAMPGFISVSAYGYLWGAPTIAHACAVRTGAELWCWGANQNHESSPENLEYLSSAKRVFTDTPWQTVVTGEYFSCALSGEQKLFCWGKYYQGTPEAILPGVSWLAISAHERRICGIQIDHSLWCSIGGGEFMPLNEEIVNP